MGNRFFNERGGKHVSFSEKWASPGEGKYWKRKMHKARRQYWRLKMRGIPARQRVGYESTVNYKNW